MKKVYAIVLGLAVALALLAPLAATNLSRPASASRAPILRVADGPMPTPTPHTWGGDSGCHAVGC